MFDHLVESSQRDDSNKWSNIEFGEEIRQVESIEVHFTHLIWSSVTYVYPYSPVLLMFYSVQQFSNANFLNSQPNPML